MKNTAPNWIIAGRGYEASELENKIPSEVDTVVVGDGAAALACVGFLGAAGSRVLWMVGGGSSLKPVLPILEEGPGAQGWAVLASRLGVDSGAVTCGSFLREFKNKSFRRPAWSKSTAAAEHASEIRDEWLWLGITKPGAIPSRLRDLRNRIKRFILPERRRERRYPRVVKVRVKGYPRKKTAAVAKVVK